MPDDKCRKPRRDGILRERGGENIDLRQSPAEAGEEEAVGARSRVSAGGCGLPELDLEGEELVQEVGAD